MDFLSIRKKARERAEAKGAAEAERTAPAEERPVAPAAPPPAPAPAQPPPGHPSERRRRRGDERVLTEADIAEGALHARLQELAPTADARFSTWRPGSGPPPIEPDPLVFAAAVAAPTQPEEPPPPTPPQLEPPRPARTPAPVDPLDAFFFRPDEGAASVPVVGGGAAEEPAPAPPEALEEYLTFRAGSEEFAIPIAHAREVMRAPGITEVPRAPRHVIGVVTVRGEVVAVIDARRRLGLPEGSGSAGRIMIVDAGEGPLGLLVDEVASVVRLPRGSIEPCPQGIQATAADCVTGIGRYRDRLFMVVDVGMLLGRERRDEGR